MRRIYVLKGMIMKLCYIYSSFNRVNLAVGLIAGSLSVAAGNAVALNYSYPIPYQVVSDNGLCLADSGDRLNLKLEQCSAAARPQKFFASDAAGAMVYDFEQILSSGATADILMVAINDLTGGGHVAPQFRLIAWQSPPGVAPGVGLMTAGAIGAVTKISGGVIDMGADIAMIASEGRPFSSSTSREVLYGAMQLYGAQGVFNSRRVGRETILATITPLVTR